MRAKVATFVCPGPGTWPATAVVGRYLHARVDLLVGITSGFTG